MVLEQRYDCQAEFISALIFHLFLAKMTAPSHVTKHREWEGWLFLCISLLGSPCSPLPQLSPVLLLSPSLSPQEEAHARDSELLVLQPGHRGALREPQLLGLPQLRAVQRLPGGTGGPGSPDPHLGGCRGPAGRGTAGSSVLSTLELSTSAWTKNPLHGGMLARESETDFPLLL